MKKYWYLKIKFKEKCEGRKIWYMNEKYMCDCINFPFRNKEECEKNIAELKKKYGDEIESITMHWTRR